jgi:tRNA-modifying protein YgfZ
MGSTASVETTLPGYREARERLAHRVRPSGILDVVGADRESFLQGQLTQDVRALAAGEVRAAAGLSPRGKLLYVARVVGLADRIRVLVPEVLGALVFEHLKKYAAFSKVVVEDRSQEFSRLGLYGPERPALSFPESSLVLPGEGEFSAEVVLPADRLPDLEAGRPRFGADMDSTNLPDEVGMNDAISTTKGCYVGQEVVARLRTYGRVNRRLVRFRFPGGPIAAGEVLRRPDGEAASAIEPGRVTSSAVSPRSGPIGLGYAFRDVPEGARLVSVSKPELSAVVSER